MSAAREPRRFGFLLVPKFAMLAFTSALEPLRAAAPSASAVPAE